MPGLIIAPRARIFHGHEWIYASEIKKSFGDPQPGDVITLKDFRDRPLGSAIFNPASQIVARRPRSSPAASHADARISISTSSPAASNRRSISARNSKASMKPSAASSGRSLMASPASS